MEANEVADVLIIGAGPSGGVAARRFVEAGLRVVCLEQGDWPDRDDYPGANPTFELSGAKQWSSSPSIRDNAADYPIDCSASDLGVVNFNGVGGGTVLFNAQWPRMLPDDFRVRSVDGVADDWPLTYHDLQPFYEANDRAFGVCGLGGNPAYPPGVDPPLPPLPIGTLATRVAKAHADLGWHWWPAPNAILSRSYQGRHPCVQRGTCGSGCNEGAKGSADVTHWSAVVAAGGTVRVGARARRIVVDAAGLACGAEWIDVDGRVHYQPADLVVLASNAIGTARLLLNSRTPAQPDGLANSSGLVGRRLMLHPLLGVTGRFDHPPADGWRAHNGALIQSLQFADSDSARGFVRGATWALGTAGGPLRAVFDGDANAWGPSHHRHVAERLGKTASWVVICEDLPDESNRVELSTTLIDGSGIPAPALHYTLSENTRAMMAWHAARATESLLAAGATGVESRMHAANGHFMGTARMGVDPATSVVDPWGRCHDVPNLLVVDGSVFVTAGSANPTSTIAAVALRAADHLVTHRAYVPRPEHSAHPVAFPRAIRASRSPATPRASVNAPVFDPGLRRTFAVIADLLIPSDNEMPAASTVGVHEQLLDQFLAARPDLARELHTALGASSEDVQLEDLDPSTLRVLRYAAAGSYYLSPEVTNRLSFRVDAFDPVLPERVPAYVADGLLDHLITDPPT